MICPRCHYYDITKDDDSCPCCGWENPEYDLDEDEWDDNENLKGDCSDPFACDYCDTTKCDKHPEKK